MEHLNKDLELPSSEFLIDINGKVKHYLLDILETLGYCKNTPNGCVGIDINDIYVYSKMFGIEFETWEVKALLKMSEAFAMQINGNKDTPYPLNGGIAIDIEKYDRIMNG